MLVIALYQVLVVALGMVIRLLVIMVVLVKHILILAHIKPLLLLVMLFIKYSFGVLEVVVLMLRIGVVKVHILQDIFI